MDTEKEIKEENSPRSSGHSPSDCSVVVKMDWRSVETHTITRVIPPERIESFNAADDFHEWLEREYRDDDFSDSEIMTEEFELESTEYSSPNKEVSTPDVGG